MPNADRRADTPKHFLEHLDDLRSCLIRVVAAWLLGTLLVIPFTPWLLGVLTLPLVGTVPDPDSFVRTIHFAGGMRTVIQLTFWGGLAVALPWMIGFAAQFVVPGLTARERRTLGGLTVGAGVLFVLGVYLGYSQTLPLAIRFTLILNRWLGVEMHWVEVADYTGFTLRLLLAFGLAFELPVLVLGAGFAGLVDADTLARLRRGVIVGIFALAMILTPPEPFSQVLMAVPMVVLYELCIVLLRIRMRRRGVAEAE